MNKSLIQKRFAKNLTTYNENAVVQKVMAEKLYSMLDAACYDKILEIGCGTGILTSILSQKLNYKEFTANDLIGNCEDYIKSINPQIEFFPMDIENFVQRVQTKYDLIISNAVFQWIENFETFLSELYGLLEDGGSLLFSTFGENNFQEISSTLGVSLKYNSREYFQTILKDYDYEIIEDEIKLDFPTPKDVLKHIQKTGVNALVETHWTKSNMKNFETSYNFLTKNKPTLTYNPIYVKIKK